MDSTHKKISYGKPLRVNLLQILRPILLERRRRLIGVVWDSLVDGCVHVFHLIPRGRCRLSQFIKFVKNHLFTRMNGHRPFILYAFLVRSHILHLKEWPKAILSLIYNYYYRVKEEEIYMTLPPQMSVHYEWMATGHSFESKLGCPPSVVLAGV